VAESVSSGVLQLALSSVREASRFYQGGMTVYNGAQKYKHLQVEPIHATEVNCVSEQVAIQLALNILGLFQSHWGLSITGYASPVPESDNGVYAFFAITCRGVLVRSGRIDPQPADTLDLQIGYAMEVCRCLDSELAVQSYR